MLGVLSLDTAFPRILGDVGNPQSYPFPTRIKVVEGADSAEIVRDGPPSEALLRRFEAAAIELEAEGARAIVSTCGFLVGAQARIANAVAAPVMLSALSLYPIVQATCPGQIGVLTASRASLGPNLLAAAGIDPEAIRVAGLEATPVFADAFLAPRAAQTTAFDRAAMEAAVLEACDVLLASETKLSAIILECGNLPPYADAIRRRSGLPVFHLLDAAVALVASSSAGGRAEA